MRVNVSLCEGPVHSFRSLRAAAAAVASIVLFWSAPSSATPGIPRVGIGVERVLYRFTGGRDGASPAGPLVVSRGALIGTTTNGGDAACRNDACGSVFALTPDAGGVRETVLYRFAGGLDGANPNSGLTVDATGALYGTTSSGGACASNRFGCGTVYELRPSAHGYVERVLHRFGGGTDGAYPQGGVIAGPDGALYGTTQQGGGRCGSFGGCGTVFALVPGAGGYVERILHAFTDPSDGRFPLAGLIADGHGGWYGTTGGGGAPVGGFGTVFTLTPAGRGAYAETVIYRFAGGSDGWDPDAPLTADGRGTLYGVTYFGGSAGCFGNGCGTVFALTPNGASYVERIVHRFGDGEDGQNPLSALVADAVGNLFGTTPYGGASGNGTIFELRRAAGGYDESVLYAFGGAPDGAVPAGSLFIGPAGRIFGATVYGGYAPPQAPLNAGTVFTFSR